MIRTMVVEDFPIIRDAIVRGLLRDSRVKLLGAYSCGHDLLEAVAGERVDALLVDLHLPDMEGEMLIERVLRVSPRTRITVFTASEQPRQMRAAMAAGAHGYVVKRQDMRQVVDALVRVHEGATVVSPQVAEAAEADDGDVAAPAPSALSLRECDIDILRRVGAGDTDSEIGQALFISTRTVQNHLARIRKIAGVGRRPELARWAIEQGLI